MYYKDNIMPILYICKSTNSTAGEISNFPEEIKNSEWNSSRKASLQLLPRTELVNNTGNVINSTRCRYTVFSNIESANEYVAKNKLPDEYRSTITEWNSLHNISRDHKFYNIDSQKINSDINDLLATLTDTDIEPSIDVSTLC
jgi:hypothetical protein